MEVSVVDNPAFRTYEVAAARTLQVTDTPDTPLWPSGSSMETHDDIWAACGHRFSVA